jgi:4'-phosphopantetheinyl transferase
MEDSVPIGLGPDELHVRSLRFADAASLRDRFQRQLDHAERVQSRRFATDELRRRWAIGRGAVREILAGYLGIAARDVAIVPRPCVACGGPHGKPALAPPADGLRFNVSHTGELLLVAVAHGREVGIDAEPVGRARPLASTAHSWLGDPESRALECVPPQERDQALLRLWTLKEAYLKAVGVGLNADLREVVVALGGEPALQAAPAEPHPERWLLLPVETPDDTVASLAVRARADDSPMPQVVVRAFEP